MPRIDVAQRSDRGIPPFVSASTPLTGVGPDAVLGSRFSGCRGFWAREGRWIAHAGEVLLVDGATGSGNGNRFREMWKTVRALPSLTDSVEVTGTYGDLPRSARIPHRFFGGFAFRDDHVAAGPWAAFPSARFVLPEVELVGGREGGTLILRRALDFGQERAEGLKEVRTELQELAERLRQAGPAPGPRGMEEEIPGKQGGPADLESATTVVSGTDPERWGEMVERALAEIDGGAFSKVVLARTLVATLSRPRHPHEVALDLWRENPGAYVFLFEPTPGHAFVGAAPETLATVSDGVFRATAVAGSVGKGRSEEEQEALGRQLLQSEKDRREHRVCVEDMMARLGEIAVDARADDEPHLLTLSSIQHLETGIEARLQGRATVLAALDALHPTPAVCGFPRDPALAFLKEAEPFQRGWYAGPVGWFDEEGDGVFVPALRSALSRSGTWRLFAGAGVVSGSDAKEEWEETHIKFVPMLNALAGRSGTGATGQDGSETGDPVEGGLAP